VTFKWTHQCQLAMDTLISKLTSAPVLAYPDANKEYILHCDASGQALGAVLSQQNNKQEHPVAYASRALSDVERRYTVSEREALAILWALDHFKYYTYGKRVRVITDHKPLVETRSLKEPTKRFSELMLKLQGFLINLQYKPGRHHQNADALSRLKCNNIELTSSIDWPNQQDQDDALSDVKVAIHSGRAVDESNPYAKFIADIKLLDSNVLIFAKPEGTFIKDRIIVPDSVRSTILMLNHDHPLAGHMGRRKTYERIKQHYFWPSMRKDIFQYCQSCQKCQQHSRDRCRRAPLRPIAAQAPWDYISIDVAGPLQRTKNGNTYILAAIDHFSKYVIARPVNNFTALTTAKFLFNNIVCQFGPPLRILTDQGRNFESELINQLCQMLNIEKLRTTAYHPQGNGAIERYNRTLKQILSKYVNEKHTDWDTYLPQALYAYNTSVHDSTGVTPYEVVFGHTANPMSYLKPPAETSLVANSYLDRLIRHNSEIRKRVAYHNDQARAQQKRYYDSRATNGHVYKIGDLVWLTNIHLATGPTQKFVPKYVGPYTVRAIHNLTYTIEDEAGRLINVHYNRLKPYYVRDATPSDAVNVQAAHNAAPRVNDAPVINHHRYNLRARSRKAGGM
jgi:transposase InsO family protein